MNIRTCVFLFAHSFSCQTKKKKSKYHVESGEVPMPFSCVSIQKILRYIFFCQYRTPLLYLTFWLEKKLNKYEKCPFFNLSPCPSKCLCMSLLLSMAYTNLQSCHSQAFYFFSVSLSVANACSSLTLPGWAVNHREHTMCQISKETPHTHTLRHTQNSPPQHTCQQQ